MTDNEFRWQHRVAPEVNRDPGKDARAWALDEAADALAKLPGQRSNTEGGSPSYVYSSSGWSAGNLLGVAEWLVSGIRPLDEGEEEEEDESPEESLSDAPYVRDADGDTWESLGDGDYRLVSCALNPDAVGNTLAGDWLRSKHGPLTPCQLDQEPEQA